LRKNFQDENFLFTVIFFVGLFSNTLFGQSQLLDANNVKAWISPNFRLFARPNDPSSVGFFAPANEFPLKSTIKDAEFWMGGIDAGGNLKISTYIDWLKMDSLGFGPVDPTTFSSLPNAILWNRVWKVTKTEIDLFKADFLDGQFNFPIPQAILRWPGRGNIHFEAENGFPLPTPFQRLAPFFDTNFDNIYNPFDGDYPTAELAETPDQICWTVFNSTTKQFSTAFEIQLLAYSYNCPNTILNNTIFTKHKFVNRGFDRIDSTTCGFWVDFNIGGAKDDRVGCDSIHKVF
jgi:hypothetical protein